MAAALWAESAAVGGVAAVRGAAVREAGADGPPEPAVGATRPGICAAGWRAAADPAPALAGTVVGAMAGDPSPGMVACPPVACSPAGCPVAGCPSAVVPPALGWPAAGCVAGGCATAGCVAAGCDPVIAGDAAGVGAAEVGAAEVGPLKR